MKLLISIFIGLLAIEFSIAQQDESSTSGFIDVPISELKPVLPDFCTDERLNKNEKVMNCCNEIISESKIVSYSSTVGPIPDACNNCGRVCIRYFNKKRGDDATEMPEITTTESESSEECECGGSDESSATTQLPEDQVSSTKPPRNPRYPEGPAPSSKLPKLPGSTPQGQVASHKPPMPVPSTELPKVPGYPQGPASSTKPPRNPRYPEGPAPSGKLPKLPGSTPQGQVASHKPPMPVPSTELPKVPGYPQGTVSSTKPPRNPHYPLGPEDSPSTQHPVNATTSKPSRSGRYPVGPPS